MVEGYLPTIGIECHVQFRTKSKLFSGSGNDARGAEPNTLISHIDLGMPGALPVLNEKAVEYGTRAAFALGTRPQKFSKFDRKHYFYPDLPLGYQITQFYDPIIKDGEVAIRVNGELKKVRIHEAHLEADAGKSSHPAGADYSLIDLNRVGTPLLEIVSEPDMHSASQARAYVRELHVRMRYAGVSDADLFLGNMRFDVNVSVSKDPNELGTRTETKNLNSFKSVEKAVEYEIKRQIDLLEKGEVIVQETRGWDEAKQKTTSQRGKEMAHDYRYMPEPDIPPIVLEDKWIDEIEKSMPVMPAVLYEKLHKLGIDESAVETLIDAIAAGKFMLDILEKHDNRLTKRIANWLATEVQAMVSAETLTWEDAHLDAGELTQLAKMADDNQVSSTGAKAVLAVLVKDGGDPLTIAKERDLLQVSDEGEIEVIVKAVLEANPKAADDVKNGEIKAIGFLVGRVMKESGGKANPQLAQQLIKKQLSL
jgi:aspartyl-tRNA(Asn)/glutamyl-tRNA(Gln) amidotransferase subunit B